MNVAVCPECFRAAGMGHKMDCSVGRGRVVEVLCECGHDEDDHPMLPASKAAQDPDYNTPCLRCSCLRFR